MSANVERALNETGSKLEERRKDNFSRPKVESEEEELVSDQRSFEWEETERRC